jgi:hypothetical protein
MTHNVTKDNKSHVKHISLYMCQICLTIFWAHGAPNTPEVKPTEDNCEAYFTQHVSNSNVTLCRCQMFSVAPRNISVIKSHLTTKILHNKIMFNKKKEVTVVSKLHLEQKLCPWLTSGLLDPDLAPGCGPNTQNRTKSSVKNNISKVLSYPSLNICHLQARRWGKAAPAWLGTSRLTGGSQAAPRRVPTFSVLKKILFFCK